MKGIIKRAEVYFLLDIHSLVNQVNAKTSFDCYSVMTHSDFYPFFQKFEVSKLLPLQGGKRVPVRVQDVYTDSEEESNKSTGGENIASIMLNHSLYDMITGGYSTIFIF